MLVNIKTLTGYRICVTSVITLWSKFRNTQYSVDILKLVLKLVNYHDHFFEPPFPELYAIVSKHLSPDLTTRFLKHMEQLQSPDDLLNHFEYLKTLILQSSESADSPVDQQSPMGVYLQSCYVAFSLLSFCSFSALYQQFQDYIQSHSHSQPAKNVITDQCLELYIYKAIKAIEPNLGYTQPVDEREMGLLLEHCSHIYQTHFLKYLFCLNARDISGAEECLHSYFDSQSQSQALSADPFQSQSQTSALHFAALNLSLLHFYFERYDMALETLAEASHVAQQVDDEEGLVYILGLLIKVALVQGDNKFASDLVTQCFHKNNVLPDTLGDKIRLLFEQGEADRDGEEGISKADAIFSTIDEVFKLLLKTEDRILVQSTSSTLYLLRSHAHTLFGHGIVSRIYSEIVLNDVQASIPCKATAALLLLEDHKTAKEDVTKLSSSLECSLYNKHTVDILEQRFEVSELTEKQSICSQLSDLAFIGVGNSEDLKNRSLIMSAKYNWLVQNYQSALGSIRKVRQKLSECGTNRQLLVKAILVEIDILLSIDEGITSFCSCEQALSICKEYGFKHLEAQVQLRLCGVYISAFQLQTAYETLSPFLGYILENCSPQERLKATEYLKTSKCR